MKKERGFTLIELIITLLIAGILLVIGVPSMQSFEQNNRLTAQHNSLIAAIQLARSEAIRRGSRITVCSSTDGLACANSTNWSTGWLVKDDSDTVIQVWSTLSGDSTLTSTANDVQYLATGYQSSSSTITYTLTRPACTGEQIKTISINPVGRPSSSTSTCP